MCYVIAAQVSPPDVWRQLAQLLKANDRLI
jgi:hypothetical protein